MTFNYILLINLPYYVWFFRCCNTCEDVKEAYRIRRWALPDLSTIEQCKDDESIERTNLALKEGCQIYGYMEVNRVKNKFIIFLNMYFYNKLC